MQRFPNSCRSKWFLLLTLGQAKAKDVHGMTALMWATRQGLQGAFIDEAGKSECWPACRYPGHGHVDVMRSLLGDGWFLQNDSHMLGCSPLH